MPANVSSNVVASKIVRTEPSGFASIQAPVSAADVASGTLTMLGVTVDVSGAQFEDPADAASFIALITLNSTIVEAEGIFAGGELIATEVRICDED